MDDKFVSFLAFESATSRQERTIKRLWILCLVLIITLLGSNAGWIYYESQWEVVENSIEQDIEATSNGDSNLNLNAIGGDYFGGEGENKAEDNNQE